MGRETYLAVVQDEAEATRDIFERTAANPTKE